jgi:hypothetical protein
MKTHTTITGVYSLNDRGQKWRINTSGSAGGTKTAYD